MIINMPTSPSSAKKPLLSPRALTPGSTHSSRTSSSSSSRRSTSSRSSIGKKASSFAANTSNLVLLVLGCLVAAFATSLFVMIRYMPHEFEFHTNHPHKDKPLGPRRQKMKEEREKQRAREKLAKEEAEREQHEHDMWAIKPGDNILQDETIHYCPNEKPYGCVIVGPKIDEKLSASIRLKSKMGSSSHQYKYATSHHTIMSMEAARVYKHEKHGSTNTATSRTLTSTNTTKTSIRGTNTTKTSIRGGGSSSVNVPSKSTTDMHPGNSTTTPKPKEGDWSFLVSPFVVTPSVPEEDETLKVFDELHYVHDEFKDHAVEKPKLKRGEKRAEKDKDENYDHNPHIHNNFLSGVFDGHNAMGDKVAKYASEKFHQKLSYKLNDAAFVIEVVDGDQVIDIPEEDVISAINETFFAINDKGPDPDFYLGGTSATVTLRFGDKLYIANVGNSQTLVGSCAPGTSVPVRVIYATSKDTVLEDDERARIKSVSGNTGLRGGMVRAMSSITNKRMSVEVSRSIGDWDFKDLGVTAEPRIEVIHLSKFREGLQHHHKHMFVMSGSDGIMEHKRPIHIAESFCSHFVGQDVNATSAGQNQTAPKKKPGQFDLSAKMLDIFDEVQPKHGYHDALTGLVVKIA